MRFEIKFYKKDGTLKHNMEQDACKMINGQMDKWFFFTDLQN